MTIIEVESRYIYKGASWLKTSQSVYWGLFTFIDNIDPVISCLGCLIAIYYRFEVPSLNNYDISLNNYEILQIV